MATFRCSIHCFNNGFFKNLRASLISRKFLCNLGHATNVKVTSFNSSAPSACIKKDLGLNYPLSCYFLSSPKTVKRSFVADLGGLAKVSVSADPSTYAWSSILDSPLAFSCGSLYCYREYKVSLNFSGALCKNGAFHFSSDTSGENDRGKYNAFLAEGDTDSSNHEFRHISKESYIDVNGQIVESNAADNFEGTVNQTFKKTPCDEFNSFNTAYKNQNGLQEKKSDLSAENDLKFYVLEKTFDIQDQLRELEKRIASVNMSVLQSERYLKEYILDKVLDVEDELREFDSRTDFKFRYLHALTCKFGKSSSVSSTSSSPSSSPTSSFFSSIQDEGKMSSSPLSENDFGREETLDTQTTTTLIDEYSSHRKWSPFHKSTTTPIVDASSSIINLHTRVQSSSKDVGRKHFMFLHASMESGLRSSGRHSRGMRSWKLYGSRGRFVARKSAFSMPSVQK